MASSIDPNLTDRNPEESSPREPEEATPSNGTGNPETTGIKPDLADSQVLKIEAQQLAPGPDEDADDARSLGEHIRTVHFALLTVCLILLGAVLQYQPAPLATAIHDLKAISGLKDYTDKINSALNQAADTAIEAARIKGRSLQKGQPIYALGTWPDGTKASFELQYPRSFLADATTGHESEDGLKYSAQTVGEFAVFWNGLGTVEVLPIPSLKDTEYKWSDNLDPKSLGRTLILENSLSNFRSAVKAQIKNIPDDSPLLKPEPRQLQYENSTLKTATILGRWQLSIEISYEPITVDMQKNFLDAIGRASEWKTGSFNQTFGELSFTQASIIYPLKFSDALEYETRQSAIQASKDDNIEIFGAKLPRKSIGNWGTFVLIGIQIYLLLIISQFRKQFWDRGYRVRNWIGTYGGIGPAVFTIVTCTLLPTFLTIFVLARGWSTADMPVRVFYAGATVVSILSLFCLNVLFLYFAEWIPSSLRAKTIRTQ